jgi:hypothetical protein
MKAIKQLFVGGHYEGLTERHWRSYAKALGFDVADERRKQSFLAGLFAELRDERKKIQAAFPANRGEHQEAAFTNEGQRHLETVRLET